MGIRTELASDSSTNTGATDQAVPVFGDSPISPTSVPRRVRTESYLTPFPTHAALQFIVALEGGLIVVQGNARTVAKSNGCQREPPRSD